MLVRGIDAAAERESFFLCDDSAKLIQSFRETVVMFLFFFSFFFLMV